MYLYLYNYISMYLIPISGHKWSTTHRVLKPHRSKMSVIYTQSWKQCVLPVITTMALLPNKTENTQSVKPFNWARLTNQWKFFRSNKPTRQLISSWEFKISRSFNIIDYTLQNTLQDIHFISFAFYKCKGAYLICAYIPSYFERCKKLFLSSFYHYWTHQLNLAAREKSTITLMIKK